MTSRELFRLFVLRNMRAEKFLTLLSILGVALGIGLFVSVKVASDRAVASFEAGVRGVEPHTNYEILDTAGTDFPEGIYARVRHAAPESFPVLAVDGYLPSLHDTVAISGIDIVRSARFLDLAPSSGAGYGDLFTVPGGVVITKRFAVSHALRKGQSVEALVYDRTRRLSVVGIIDRPGLPADTFIMDLGNFQNYFGKAGYLSRIDVAASSKAVSEIELLLPSSLSLQPKAQLIENRKALVKSFRYNLQFVSLIAILVGIFLLYNTIFISVVKRRTEIGILRGLGMTRRTVLLLFTSQGLALGLTGSIIGTVFGQAAAYFSTAAVQKTISTMYGAISISDYLVSPADILLALGLGLAVSLTASAIPAYEASRVRPTESAKEGTFESKYRGRRKAFATAGAVLLPMGCLLSWIDYHSKPFDFPFLSYGGILLLILGATFLSPSYLSLLLRLLKRPIERVFRTTGGLTVADMRGSVYRLSVALMSVAISCSLIFSLLTLIFSFRNSLKQWIGRNIAADVYVKPASCKSNFCYFPLSGELVKTIEDLPEVAGVDRFRTLMIDFRGRKIVAGFGDRGIRKRLGREGGGKEDRIREYPGDGRIVGISKYLGVKYGLRPGDRITLDTPKGKKRFTVVDVFSSYSTTSGFIYLDRKWLKEDWGLDDATQLGVYLRKGTATKRVITRLKATLLPRYSLEITDTAELRQSVLSIFDRTFAITYAIELISIAVSLIGVINTLLAMVLERKRELSIFRYLGGSWNQIRAMLVLTAGIVGAAGILMGGVIGPVMSVIFIEVINAISFGWEIAFQVPAFPLAAVTISLFLTTLAAGLLPLNVARRIDPKRFISFE
ncbi:MAG: FtsX-like permease family protein [Nitrospiraceae bacterium]|nr:FtsX-like permease family protein [Nitrospiraceae bacterium]